MLLIDKEKNAALSEPPSQLSARLKTSPQPARRHLGGAKKKSRGCEEELRRRAGGKKKSRS